MRTSERTLHEFEVANLPSSVQLIRGIVSHEISALPLSAQAQFDLLTALVEAADNAVLYGQSIDGRPNLIRTRVLSAKEGVQVELSDNGPGFRPKIEEWELPDLMSERGRGVFLMKTLTDEVVYPDIEAGTTCVLRKRFDFDGEGSAAKASTPVSTGEIPGRAIPNIYRSLIENAIEGIWVVDSEAKTSFVNERAAHMLGYPPREILGRSFLDFLAKQDRAEYEAARKSNQTGENARFEATLLTKDSRRLYALVAFSPFYDEKGRYGGSLALLTDVTEIRSAEKALREAEARASNLIRYAPTGICEVDFRGPTFKSVNDAMCVMSGYSREELLAMSAFDLLDLESRILFKERIDKARAGEPIPAEAECRVNTKDGRELWVVLNAQFVGDGDALTGAFIIGHDVTERRQLQARLAESAKKYSTLFDSTSDGVWISNLKAELVEVNDAYCRMSGYTREELLSLQIGDVEAAESPPEVDEHIRRLIEGGGHDRFESRHRRKDGSVYDVDVTALYLGKEEGRMAIFVRDITERKRTEKRIERHKEVVEGINGILRSALTSETEEKFGQVCLEVACRLTDSRLGFVGEICADGLLHLFAISDPGWEACSTSDSAGHRRAPGIFDVHGLSGVLIKTGKALLTNDPPAQSESIGVPQGHPTLSSFLGVPMLSHGRTTGMIAVANRQGGYEAEQLDALEQIAPVIVEALSRRRAEEAHQKLLEAYEAEYGRVLVLKEIAAATASSLSLSQICERFLQVLEERMDLRAGNIYWFDEREHLLRHLALVGFPSGIRPSMATLPLDGGSNMSRLFVEDLPILTHEAEGEPQACRERRRAMGLGETRWIALPIEAKDKKLGVVALFFSGRRAFSREEISLYRTLTDQLAVAMENGRLFEGAREAREQTEQELERSLLILEATSALASKTSLQDVLDVLGKTLLYALRHTRVTVSLLNEESRTLEVALSLGKKPLQRGLLVRLEDLSPPAREAIDTYAHTLIDCDGLEEGSRGVGETVPCHLALDIPLVFQGRLVGLLAVDDPDERTESSEREIQLARGIADQAAMAIESARLYEVEHEAARLNEALNEIDATIHSSLNGKEILERVLADAAVVLGADSGAVSRREGGLWRVACVHGMSKKLVGSRMSDSEEPHGLLAMETGEIVAIEDARDDERVPGERMKEFGIRSVLVAPLVVRDLPLGVIFFNFESRQVHFSRSQIDFTRKLAASISLALDNARLYEEEHHVAEVLRDALIRPIPTVPQLDLGVVYQSASERERVGGDFYDVFHTPCGRIAVIAGDVSGKGVKAAAITETVRSGLRSLIEGDLSISPAAILSRLNRALVSQVEPGVFATVLLLLLNPDTREIAVASAGHPAPVRCASDCSIIELSAGPPLAIEDAEYVDHLLTMDEEELLFLYSDGLTEARRRGEFYGEERLLRRLSCVASGEAQTVVDRVVEDATRFANGRLSDDLVALAFRIADESCE